jgi:hypothetical protein
MPLQAVCVSFFIVAALVSSTYAAAILDQRNDDLSALSNPGLSLFFENIKQAQTFTVGITGTLVQLDIYLDNGTLVNAPVLDIRRLAGAQPSDSASDILASQSILTSRPPSPAAFVSFTFNVPVSAGEQLAFVVSQPNGPIGDLRLLDTVSATTDYYPRGNLWTSGNPPIAGGGWYPNGNSSENFDVGFRTFVDPVPEPGTFTLLAAGLTAVGWVVRRRYREQTICGRASERRLRPS